MKIPKICMYVNKNTSQNIYVCLGSKIPWTRMYIEKYLTKIYVCLGSKIPHEKKASKKRKRRKKKNNNKKKSCLAKKQHACEKR